MNKPAKPAPIRPRGFAAMSPERRREIAALGGRSLPNSKRSFSLDPALAARAGRKGGLAVRPESRTFSLDHEFAREAGRKGGKASSNKGKPHAKSS